MQNNVSTNDVKKIEKNGFSRRDFLKSTAFVGGCAALMSQAVNALQGLSDSEAFAEEGKFAPYVLAQPQNQLYSTCLQCHTDCQVKVKIWDGTLAKITGNPYSPQNFLPHIPYETTSQAAATIDGKLCVKGQTGIQTYYDPYRIRKVLKRDGPRGSNKWKTIPFNQFIEEVVKGGKLFSAIGDNGHYPGFDEVIALRDPELSSKMTKDAWECAEGTPR